MTSAVEALSLERCPECGGGMTAIQDRVKNCLTCGGTGARVPGLRKPCDTYVVDGVEFHSDCTEYAHECCSNCQGTKQVLIPSAEVMGVLVRYGPGAVHVELRWNGERWTVRRVVILPHDDPRGYLSFDSVGDTPEEALAAAISKALGAE